MRGAAAEIKARANEGFSDVLTADALDFLGRLHREVEPVRAGLLEKRRDRDARRAAARLASRRASPDDRRRADLRRGLRLRAVCLPQRDAASRARKRTVFLPTEDGEPS